MLIIGVGLICSSHAAQTNEATVVVASMFTRALHLDSAVLSQMRLQVPPKTGETSQDYLLRYFKTQQVEFVAPAFLKLDEASGRLTVKTKETDLDKIEQLVFKPDSEVTDSGFTQVEIQEFTSVISRNTTNAIMGFSRSPKGNVIANTSGEMFELHHGTNGWVILHKAEAQWVLPK